MWKINAIGFLEIKCKLLVKLFSPLRKMGLNFKFPTWFIRVSKHEKCLRQVETEIKTHYETEMITVIKYFETRKSQLRFQINVLKSFASDPNLVVTNNLLETLEERKRRIYELRERIRTLEEYISKQSYDQDAMPVIKKIVDN